MTEAEILNAAAAILRARSTKPNSITLGVICNVLRGTAEKCEAERIDTIRRGLYQAEPDWSLMGER